MTKNSPRLFNKKIAKALISITALAIFFLFILTASGGVSDFKSQTWLETAEFDSREMIEQTNDLLRDCYGFEGVCTLDSIGVRLELVFHGIALKIPSPNFLNITGWGDNRGWSVAKVYFGTREFKVINTESQEDKSFTQSFWNRSAYSSFKNLVVIDLRDSVLYVSSKGLGYSSIGVYERGWVVQF